MFKPDENKPSSDLLDFLHPRKTANLIKVPGSSYLRNAAGTEPKQNTMKNDNLIDLDELHITNKSRAAEIDKERQISDFQIKMLEEFLTTSKSKNKETQCLLSSVEETEFQKFFDSYEFNNNSNTYQRILERTAECNGDPVAQSSSSFPNIDEDPKLVEEYAEVQAKKTSKKSYMNEDYDDEVMLENQQTYTTEKEQDTVRKQSTENRTPKVNFGSDSYVQSKHIFDEILNTNKIKCFKAAVDEEYQASKADPKVLNSPSTTKFNSEPGDSFETKTKLEQKALTNHLVTKCDIKYLETISKTEKTFKKRSILKSEAEKSSLTRGPSLYEKTVILPQIMERINEKHRQLEDKMNTRLRLILDEGPTSRVPPFNFYCNATTTTNLVKTLNSKGVSSVNSSNGLVLNPPEVLMADCNKERLKAFEAAKQSNKCVQPRSHFVP